MKISFLLTKLSCADSFPNKTRYLVENVCGYPVPGGFAVVTRSFMSHMGCGGCFKKVKIRALTGGRLVQLRDAQIPAQAPAEQLLSSTPLFPKISLKKP